MKFTNGKSTSATITVIAGVQPGKMNYYSLPVDSTLEDLITEAGGLENGDWGDLTPKEVVVDGQKKTAYWECTVGTEVIEPTEFAEVVLEDGDIVGFKKQLKGNN